MKRISNSLMDKYKLNRIGASGDDETLADDYLAISKDNELYSIKHPSTWHMWVDKEGKTWFHRPPPVFLEQVVEEKKGGKNDQKW